MTTPPKTGTSVAPGRVVVLTPDLSSNAVGRALVFADLLTSARRVTLAGSRGGPLWPPLASRSDIDILELPRNPFAASKIVREFGPEVALIASKPLLMSYGVALASGRRPIVLDIDDPELALATADPKTLVSTWFKTTNPLITAGLVFGRRSATAITVSSKVLRARYGGTVIPHARDERIFDATLRDRSASRQALGISSEGWIVAYVGTMRGHKGVGELRNAAQRLPRGVKLALVGSDGDQPRGNEIHVPAGPYRSAMQWVSAADVVVVPQLPTAVGRAQSPAKLVDALAMGRAIVASRLAPVIETVGDCAVLVEPGSVDDLVRGLMTLLDSPERRQELETSGRQRFVELFGFDAVRPRLISLLEAVRI